MVETRSKRVGEPNSVAATDGWQQGKPQSTCLIPVRATFSGPLAKKKRPGRAGAFKSAAKALRALDYLLLVAGAEDMAFLA